MPGTLAAAQPAHRRTAAVLQDGSTPLHIAAYQGHVDVVRLLLERGASAEAKLNVRNFPH